ncbi:hypothetical protein [Romboutsia ilealis]|uniref:hypothetical protein n=1 Tax=Romboutsia ilealis TaxID=1115758 RepID=UPI0025700812|nr:hypothetical protein [Romboutsia ilealis]
MYSLYYIKGISRFDTPRFANIIEQNNYFDLHKKKTIDEFYPPFFTNSIKMLYTDFDIINNEVNYFSLVFRNKTYYYFIDNVNYIDLGVYEINITLDVIQTYFFDIKINSINVIRQSINRWNGNDINREYIRENLSNSTDFKRGITYNSIPTNKWLLVEGVSKLDTGSEQYAPSLITIKDILITNGTYLYLLPLPNINKAYQNKKINIFLRDELVEQYTYIDYIKALNSLMRNPNVLNISFINMSENNNLDYNISYNETIDITINYNPNVYSLKTYLINTNNVGSVFIEKGVNFINKIEYKIQFDKNTSRGINFNYRYIPQLFDENYIDFKWGERLGYTSISLSKLKSSKLVLDYKYDLCSGERIYNINSSQYFTNIVNKTKQNIRLYNGAWENYLATNKGTLTTGIDLAKQNNLFQTSKNIFNSSALGIAGSVTGNPSLITGATGGLLNSYVDYFIKDYNIEQNLKITKENLIYTPDTEKQGNTITSDIENSSLEIFTYTAYVDDIEEVGRKLEYFGYKVNKLYNNVTLYGNELYNRVYYNVIKADEIFITISNHINTEDLIFSIKERLRSGLRLWNMNNNVEMLTNLKYDNVEV